MRSGALPVIAAGQAALVLCSVAYVVWWALAFRPPISSPRPVGRGFLAAAVVCGVLGVVAVLAGTVWVAVTAGSAALWGALAAVLAGGFLYRVLLALTTGPLHRPLTTELPLIVVWTTVELAAWGALTRGGLVTGTPALVGWLAIGVTFVVSMACYVAFYRLPPVPAYLAGMGPLATAGLAAATLGVIAWNA